MEYSYLVRLSNAKIYKEVQLPNDLSTYKIGFSTDCNARFFKNDFFTEFELTFTKVKSSDGSATQDHWQITCSDGVYLEFVADSKEFVKELHHSNKFKIKDNENDSEILKVEFVFDFENETKNYDRQIDISGTKEVFIGGASNNNIVLKSRYTANDSVILVKKDEKHLVLTINKTKYGVYHDGKKAKTGEVINSGDFISIADFSFYYKDGSLYTEATDDVVVTNISAYDSGLAENYPKFIRNTRLNTVLNEEKIEILDPPAKPEKPKNNLFTRLLPSFGMIIMAVVMGLMGGGTMIIFSAVSAVSAIITAVVGVRQSKKDFVEQTEGRITKYNNYIDNKKAEIEGIRKEELETLEKIYISQADEQVNFKTFSPNLFDRTAEDSDFLCVRLGLGSVEAKREINFKKQEKLEIEDDLQQKPEELSKEYKKIPNAPIVCDFKLADAVGVVGAEEDRYDIMKNMVLDITARQMFKDVKLFFIAEEEHKDEVKWLRVLPYVYNEAIGTRNVVTDGESKTLIFEYLYKELSAREQAKKFDERIVVFFVDEFGFNSHPISKFADRCKDLGVTFVFFGEDRTKIPLGIDYLVEVKGEGRAKLIDTHDDKKFWNFSYPVISNSDAEDIANILAPVYVEDISLEAALTKSLTMFDLLNIIATDDINLKQNWANSKVYKSMAAPIGVTTNDTVFLDLHDKAHGPHGLVAGTTGSGKSELLQTYILSMALLYSPEDVGFVIIDFKGGGMASQFRDYNEKHYRNLPHILGTITNIDGREIDRSLKSIKAELHKRERLFKEAGVNHIDNYIKDYKAGKLETPLPHLIVIVDEFAELKADYPDFMAELISAARTGRSLGVHLILATQKPAGQVSEQIWSNSRFKLCLKVQSPEDSNEMIKSPLAAEIKEAGRAYLQVGNNEIFELFQSAYTGGPEKINESATKDVEIFALTESGRRQKLRTKKVVEKSDKDGAEKVTQLSSIVGYIDKYCQKHHIEKLPDICLPSLPKVIDFPKNEELIRDDVATIVELGIFDDPNNQLQATYSVDLSTQNMMIIGSSQSGKTNLLQTIIRDLSTKYTPDEVNIYIIDFASMILKNFESLNHVGGVVTSSEDEKLKNLIKLLMEAIAARKEKLLAAGVSSFTAYKEAGKTDLPQIVLMIDNMTALKELYFQDDDTLLYICREGITVGISVIVSNSQTTGFGYKYLSNFPTRIAFFCNDSGEYNSLFDHCRENINDVHGRCLVEIDKIILECQSYLSFEGEKEFDRVGEIKKFVSNINNINNGVKAKRIPLIQKSITKNFMVEQFGDYMKEKFSVVMGIDYATVTPYVLDFATMGLLAIAGRESAGRHNWLKYSVEMLSTMYPNMSKVYVVDSFEKKLSSLKGSSNVISYTMIADDAVKCVNEIEVQLKDRYDALASGNESVLNDAELIMLVIDNQDALNAICNNQVALASYKNILGRYKNMKVCIVVFVDNANISYNAPEIIKNIRDSRNLMYFDDISNMKMFDIPLSMSRNFKKAIELGDGYYIKDNECIKLKTSILE